MTLLSGMLLLPASLPCPLWAYVGSWMLEPAAADGGGLQQGCQPASVRRVHCCCAMTPLCSRSYMQEHMRDMWVALMHDGWQVRSHCCLQAQACTQSALGVFPCLLWQALRKLLKELHRMRDNV